MKRQTRRVTDVIDGGEFVARSHRVAIPEGVNAVGMHRITWPQMGPFIHDSVWEMLKQSSFAEPTISPMQLREQPAEYRVRTDLGLSNRLAA